MTRQPSQSGVQIFQAPHLWPRPERFLVRSQKEEEDLPEDSSGELLHYLSWPGWELYLSRRLGLLPTPGYRPLLLDNQLDPERDFGVIDMLVKQVGELGTGFLSLIELETETVADISLAVRQYPQSGNSAGSVSSPTRPRPRLDDRAFLALWNVSEFHRYEAHGVLALSKALEQEMWLNLKGEEAYEGGDLVLPPIAPLPLPEPPDDSPLRLGQAWSSWRRLAAPFLADPSQFLLQPTASEPSAE